MHTKNSHSNWNLLINDHKNIASYNMALDETLLQNYTDTPILRFYTWQSKCYTFGYSQRVNKYKAKWQDEKLEAIRRPTGGGIVKHEQDISYSIICPVDYNEYTQDLDVSYKYFHECIIEGLKKMNIEAELKTDTVKKESKNYFCFESPVLSDIFYRGKKIVGSAQKRVSGLILQQGSIFLPHVEDLEYNALTDGFKNRMNISFDSYVLDHKMQQLVEKLNESKYKKEEWNFKY
ncbi:biotin/lipoate A/B protein ligase family protein [bacterium]